MIYNGIVTRLNGDLYLFILNHDLNTMTDGINISDHVCYKNLIENQLITVDVIFKDGTLELEDIDLEEFIHGTSYGRHDIFINIKDKMLFTLDVDLESEIIKGNFNKIAFECFDYRVESGDNFDLSLN